MTEALPQTWRCWWQDFTGWRAVNPKEAHPERQYRDFPTEEEARAFKRELQQSLDFVATVTPVTPRRIKPTKASLGPGFGRVKRSRDKHLTP